MGWPNFIYPDDEKKDGGNKTIESTDALFSKPENGKKDKLTNIKGIGPVAEKQLNKQGIVSFEQIANLTDDEILTIDENMPFSDDQIKIWKSQAIKMAKKKGIWKR